MLGGRKRRPIGDVPRIIPSDDRCCLSDSECARVNHDRVVAEVGSCCGWSDGISSDGGREDGCGREALGEGIAVRCAEKRPGEMWGGSLIVGAGIGRWRG